MKSIKNNSNDGPAGSLSDIATYHAGVAQSTAQRLLKKITEDNLKGHGISMMQWFIIGTIHDAGSAGVTVTNLSKMVDTNVPYITNTLNLLENKGIIERNNRENDNRTRYVTLSPDFETTFQHIEQDLRQKMRTILYAQLTPKELRTYVNVLYKLSNIVERDHS